MKSIRSLITLCLFLAATQIFAQVEQRPLVKVNIPFTFTAGDQTLPAGEYVLSTVQPERTIRIAGVGTAASTIQTVSSSYALRPSQNSRLVFERYGDSYFLKEVWNAGSDQAHLLSRSKREAEMAKSGVTHQFAEVVQSSSGR